MPRGSDGGGKIQISFELWEHRAFVAAITLLPLKDLTLFTLGSAQKCEFRFEVTVPTGETPRRKSCENKRHLREKIVDRSALKR